MEIDVDKFRHRYPFRIRSFHVDRQNIVHNLWYFFIFEEARVEYIREIGIPMDDQTFISHSRFYIVRNACEYHASARFDDELIILTRICSVKNSSVAFEHAAIEKKSGKILTTASHVIVHINVDTDKPERVPKHLREKIRAYEGGNVIFSQEEKSED